MNFLIRTIRFPKSVDDRSIAQFRQQADFAIRSGIGVVLVDFTEVKFLSSLGLMALVTVFKQIQVNDKRLFLCSVNEQIRMLLELTGMDEVFEIYESQNSALTVASFREDFSKEF
ncbi:STAS domain-containing protein [Phormidesmis sp. 146-35]